MKQISTLIFGFTAAFVIVPALAEDFTAGKTPAQLFRSDCSACHRSPNGLVKERGDVSGLAAFLREHYTTKAESAAALAAYVSGFASPGVSARNRGAGQPGRERGRIRGESDAPTTVAVPADTRPADEPSGRRRRAAVSGEGSRRRGHGDDDVPRPPREIGIRPAAASEQATPPQATQEAVPPQSAPADPAARVRPYLSSGLNSERASTQAPAGAPKARRHRRAGEAAAAPAAAPAASADAPAAAEPARQADPPAETAPESEPK